MSAVCNVGQGGKVYLTLRILFCGVIFLLLLMEFDQLSNLIEYNGLDLALSIWQEIFIRKGGSSSLVDTGI